jgi:hypothetical protein
LFILSINAFSQSPTATRDFVPNHIFWFSTQVTGKLKGKFTYGVDLEYRRQADPGHGYDPGTNVGKDRLNIFKNPYQEAVRPWVHYKPNDKIRISFAPITWFATWSFPVDGKTTYLPEYRTTFQITLLNNYGRVQFSHRYRYEYRINGVRTLDTDPEDPTGPPSSYSFLNVNRWSRMRYQVRGLIPLNNTKLEKGTFYTVIAAEAMVNFGKNVPNNRLLDQTRFNIYFGYKFHPEIRVELGYMNQIVYRLNNKAKNNVDMNNNLVVNLIFDNFNSLFKKKKKDA